MSNEIEKLSDRIADLEKVVSEKEGIIAELEKEISDKNEIIADLEKSAKSGGIAKVTKKDFVKMAKGRLEIKVHPLSVDQHKKLGWEVVK